MAFKDYSNTPADNIALGDGTYIGPDMLRNKVRPALQQIAADGKALADDVQDRIDLAKGDPGGDGSLIAKFTLIATQLGGTAINIPDDIDLVQTVGYNAPDVGSAIFVYDAAVDAAYVTAHPRSSFITSNSRGFRLSTEQDFSVAMFGTVADGTTNDTPAFQAMLDTLPAAGGNVIVPAGNYKLNTEPTWGSKSVVWDISPAATFTGAGTGTGLFPNTARSFRNIFGANTLLWGNPTGATWDGVSDRQAFFAQTQPTFLTNGSLGAVFGQRLATYTGGAVSDATSPATGAVRGYNQVGTGATYCNEFGGLFTADSLSYLGQVSGIMGQGNSLHGGRVWGLVGEAKEWPETFTATAGQTVFAVPNGFNAVGAVTKNGTLLTLTTHYTLASPNVTLVSGAAAGDVIKVYRGNPQNATQAAELDVYAGAGTDTANPISGNRVGLSVFGYRIDSSVAAATNIGTLVNLVCDPTDANLTVDRGILFQGKFATGIDFTASNFVPVNWLIKFGSASGVDASGNIKLASGKTLSVNANQVVGARQTGWTAATGTATRSTFATGSVTLPQLAEHVKALIDDLIAHGMIGS
jgi:hypothetical protein